MLGLYALGTGALGTSGGAGLPFAIVVPDIAHVFVKLTTQQVQRNVVQSASTLHFNVRCQDADYFPQAPVALSWMMLDLDRRRVLLTGTADAEEEVEISVPWGAWCLCDRDANRAFVVLAKTSTETLYGRAEFKLRGMF